MTQSIDPDFARRVAEYQRNLKKGVVFQADGTIGGKRIRPARRAWRGHALGHMVKLLMAAVLIKAALFHAAHIVGFDANSALALDSAPLVQQGLSLLFYPDPISAQISHWLTIGQQYLAIALRQLV
jgi:hypothetical protein